MLNFETKCGKPPVFFNLIASPSGQDRFDVVLHLFFKDEPVRVKNVTTVDWWDLGHILSSCSVELEKRGYWRVEDHDFASAPVAERAAA